MQIYGIIKVKIEYLTLFSQVLNKYPMLRTNIQKGTGTLPISKRHSYLTQLFSITQKHP